MTTELQIATEPLQVSKAQEEAWLSLAQVKNNVSFALEKLELEAQGILMRVQGEDVAYEAIDVALASYRKAFASLQDLRKPFTNVIESNIVQPLMAYEKRVDPKTNELYVSLATQSLILRKKESDETAKVNAKNAEIANFKTFVHNEFLRVAAEYRGEMRNSFAKYYEQCLNDKVKDPDIEKVKEMASEIMPPAVGKFKPDFLTTEELHEIYGGVQKPDYNSIFSSLMDDLDQRFANYSSDFANAEAAITNQKKQAALKKIEEDQKLQEEAAITTLINTAEAVTIDAPRIKTTKVVRIVESEQWAKAIMAAFITNLPNLGKYIRVKSWSKLSLGQMATYLGQLATDQDVSFTGLVLEAVEK